MRFHGGKAVNEYEAALLMTAKMPMSECRAGAMLRDFRLRVRPLLIRPLRRLSLDS